MVWVLEDHPSAIDLTEGESSLVTGNTLIGEVLEDLLQSCLRYTVLLNVEASLLVLKLAEQPSDSLVFLGHAKFEELSALLKNLYLLKVRGKEVDDGESEELSSVPLNEVNQPDFSSRVRFGLQLKVSTETIRSDLLNDHAIIEFRIFAQVNQTLERHLRLQVLIYPEILGKLLKLPIGCLLNLDLNLVANTELALDVLGTAHASEDSSSDHDTKLCRESLCLLHRVSSQDDCRLLVTLGDLLDNLPHEATSLWIHASRWLIK